MNEAESYSLDGLWVELERVEHHYGLEYLPSDKPHAFVYFLTIHNDSDKVVTLLGRRWVVSNVDGTTTIVEGEKIVGQRPRLKPGSKFSYNSFHVTNMNAHAQGSFHGIDEDGNRLFVSIPEFDLKLPNDDSDLPGYDSDEDMPF